jgi:hypothetical protein
MVPVIVVFVAFLNCDILQCIINYCTVTDLDCPRPETCFPNYLYYVFVQIIGFCSYHIKAIVSQDWGGLLMVLLDRE